MPAPIPVPPSGAPPPLPAAEPKPEQGMQAPQADKESTPTASGPVKVDTETWKRRIKLLSAAISAYEAHAKLRKEAQQLRETVQSELFRSHPAEMQKAISRRLEYTNVQVETSSSALEDKLEKLQDSDLWLSYPRQAGESSTGSIAVVMQCARLARDIGALRTQVAEVKECVKELESGTSSTATTLPRTDATQPQSLLKPADALKGAGEEPMDVEEGEIVSPSALANTLTLAEGELQSPTIDFDPRPVSERIEDLEERLAQLEGMIYQEQDDYKDRVDAYIDEKIALSPRGSVAPSESQKPEKLDSSLDHLREQIDKYEEAAAESAKYQEVLEAANDYLQEENRFLRAQLELAAQQIPDLNNLQQQLKELEAKIASHEQTAASTGPSREEIVEAVLPVLTQRIRADTQQVLESETQTMQKTLKDSGDTLLNTVMPRVDLTAQTLEQMTAWLANLEKGGGA